MSPNFVYLADDRTLKVEFPRGPTRHFEGSVSAAEQYYQVMLEAQGAEQRKTTAPIAAPLELTLNVLNHWLGIEVSQRASSGAASADSVYIDVLSRLSAPRRRKAARQTADMGDQLARIEELAHEHKILGTYGLTSPIDFDSLIRNIRGHGRQRDAVISRVLTPFIDGLEARLNELRSIYARLDRYVSALNAFFSPKVVQYQLGTGLSIHAPNGKELSASLLSSGERHLLLILSAALLATGRRTLFIIDEPEISLNARWQRALLGALLEMTSDSDVQYLMASHSMPLISRHRNHVLLLGTRGDVD